MPHVVADGPHLLQGGLDVELGTGQQVAVECRALGEGGTAQIDSGDHAPKSLRPCPARRPPVSVTDTASRQTIVASGVHPVTEREWKRYDAPRAGHDRGNATAATGEEAVSEPVDTGEPPPDCG